MATDELRGDLDTGRHDLPVSPRLAEFLRTSWATPAIAPPSLAGVAPYAAKRRRQLSSRFPGDRLVIPAGRARRRVNDQDYRFRPSSEYVHLSGDATPEGVLVLEPSASGHEAILFLRGHSDRQDDGFFSDVRYGELWVGARPTLADVAARLDLECHELSELPAFLGASAPSRCRLARGFDDQVDPLVEAPEDRSVDDELVAACAELRLIKDEFELAEMSEAIAITTRGFEDVVRALPSRGGNGERLVEVVFEARARLEGAGCGYNTIAAGGPHATTLHWQSNDGPLVDGQLLLLDAGAETNGWYTADITRTLPVSGRFSEVQRRVYDLVYAAQEAAMAEVRPGNRFRAFHRAAIEVIAEGLESWGVLPVSAKESLADDCGLHRRYTLCAFGHMLGLDVHDCAKARATTYLDAVLEPGQVLTVEPGLYFQQDDATLPAELRGIGVRIEDDVLVTESGCELLSSALPRRSDDVEEWMRRLQAAGSPTSPVRPSL